MDDSDVYPKVVGYNFLADDEAHSIALELTTEQGETHRVSMTPKIASDIVSGLLQVASDQFQRVGHSLRESAPTAVMPVQADHLEVEEGHNPREAFLSFTVGPVRVLLTLHVNYLASMCTWLARHVRQDDEPNDTRH